LERGDESGEDGRDFGGGWWRRRQCEAILSAVLESVGRGKECAGGLTYYT